MYPLSNKALLSQENPRERKKTITEKRKRDVGNISVEKIRNVLKNMKKRKAQGPDDIPLKV